MSQWLQAAAEVLMFLATVLMWWTARSQMSARGDGVSDTKVSALEAESADARKQITDANEAVGRLRTEVTLRAESAANENARINRQLEHLAERQDEMWRYFKRNGSGPSTG